jgi:hypothetical protein
MKEEMVLPKASEHNSNQFYSRAATTFRAKDCGLESRQGVRFEGLYELQWCFL